MRNISGIPLQTSPYNLNKFVGTLLFAEYPTTLIYADEKKNPIIKEWVDCSDDGKINRYFIYRVTNRHFKKYIDGSLTHLELIKNSTENYIIFQDIENDNVQSNILISIDLIPAEYKPSHDFVFDLKDSVDLDIIAQYFDLDNLEIEKDVDYVKEVAIRENSETIYFHLNSGKGIGLGRINTEVLGRTLSTFDRLYKSIALDFVKGINRGEISLDAQSNIELRAYTDTEVFAEKIRASYGFFIRPIHFQNPMFGDSNTEVIVTKTFDLIKKSQDVDGLKEEYLLHSGFTINQYKKLLETIYSLHLKIDLNWFNPSNNRQISDSLDYQKANKIIMAIENLSVSDTKDFKTKGKFSAINCNTGHFTFLSTTEEQFVGYFDKLLKNGIREINFMDVYEISIKRKIIKEAEKKDDKVQDVIIAYYIEK